MDKKPSPSVKSASMERQDLFDPQTVTIAVALLVIVLTIVFYLLGRKSSRKSILLVGLSDAGKSALFAQLAYNSVNQTVTSMKENEEQIPVRDGRKLVSLVDLPGYDRLRDQFWDKFKQRALGVVYVVDSATFMSNLHNVADLLYQYLSDDFVASKRIPLLVACTKQDEVRAKTAKAISAQLEKEFNTIRETRLGALDTTSGDENTRKVLGNPNSVFAFADLKNSIDFVDCCSVKEPKIETVLKWIDTVA